MPANLTVAFGDYDRTRPLVDGRVRAEGFRLACVNLPVEEIFSRMNRRAEFDASEMSMSHYIRRRARGDDSQVAIPVFLSRLFRHSCIFVSAKSGIERPEQLKGRRIGVPSYEMTAAVWMRGFLQDDYGLHPGDVIWLEGALERGRGTGHEPMQSPPGVRLEHLGPGQGLSDLLAEGQIDALITARAPSCFADGSGRARRLFQDFRSVEQDYYHRTGFFPIMHTVVLRKDVVAANPTAPLSLFRAFCDAKRLAVAALRDSGALRVTLPWLLAELDETERVLGSDFWPYGLARSRHEVEALAAYSFQQGLIERRVAVEELFAPETLAEPAG